MKVFFDKYKYILGLGLVLIAVVIIAVISAAIGKDTAENSGTSYLSPETSSFTTAESMIATTTPKTTVNSQAPPVTTVTDTSSQTTALQTTSQTTANSQKAETTATTAYVATVPATTAETFKATEKPITVTSTAKATAKATTTVKSTTKATAKATTPKPADKPIKEYDNTCTFVIECKTILDNKDKLKKGLEKYVPDDAVIFSKTVGFNSGESVYDILRRICDENSIQMEASYTPAFSSYYVEGINNLYEFDCGQGSGWMYSVNGVFPNYGCSSYKPANNDEIAFRYTCELGYDLQN